MAEWRDSLLDQGLKVNAGKSKVIVGSSGGKMLVNSGKWPWCPWERSTGRLFGGQYVKNGS